MGNLFRENISQISHAFSHPTHFQRQLAPCFHFILVFGGVNFSDWRCDLLYELEVWPPKYNFFNKNFDECVLINV